MREQVEREAEIVRFWSAVELFSTSTVERVDARRHVFRLDPAQPLPWEAGHWLSREPIDDQREWQHVVFLGIFEREEVFDALGRVLPDVADSYEERPAGESAIAAVVVDSQGRMVGSSAVLSSCAWAIGRTGHPGPDDPMWLDGFRDADAEFSLRSDEIARARPRATDGSGPALVADTRAPATVAEDPAASDPCVSHLTLDELLRAAQQLSGCAPWLSHEEIRVRSYHRRKPRAGAPGEQNDFLNSFFAADLAEIADGLPERGPSRPLRAFLGMGCESDGKARVDVREDIARVRAACAPDRIPPGRWPSHPAHPLSLGQQLAVNVAQDLIQAPGLMSVNGPPGTGKTTMFRDLIASLIVERARRLAELDRPDEAFGAKHSLRIREQDRWFRALKEDLVGFEIVVASANNGAVENVALEIPGLGAIDPSWVQTAESIDYFAAQASALLSATKGRDAGPAWGLIAARLGRRSNGIGFANTAWWGRGEAAPEGLLRVLQRAAAEPPETPWHEVAEDFRAKLSLVERLAARWMDADRLLQHIDARAAARQRASTEAKSARASVDQHGEVVDRLAAEYESAYRERVQRDEERARHRALHPGLFARAQRRNWRARDRQFEADLAAARVAEEAARARHAEHAALRAAAMENAERWELERNHLAAELASAEEVCEEARRVFGDALPDAAWHADRERREGDAPWTDHHLNEARSELFFAALRLHRSFCLHVAGTLRWGLQIAVDIIQGAAPNDLAPETALAAWQTLFLVVPVVSTTFASFSRLFGHIDREGLGWLLFDEAGQAAPQAAVGALWRVQRAVVVGDPKQLEPISSIPFRAEQAIRAHYRVGSDWLPSRTSAQSVADRGTTWGTWLAGDDSEGDLWVGTPLSVHRRCDRPMFDIANDIAYGGTMLWRTSPTHAEDFQQRFPSLPPSKWIDIPAVESQGHIVPAHEAQLDQILESLERAGVPMTEVMVISPFRHVADSIRQRAWRYGQITAGTIHTAQGKEADIVILMLSSDPSKDGARSWAAHKPNLLNVAVSRAKRRLYVIGDHAAWREHRHFDVLAERLPATPPIVRTAQS